MKTRAKLRWRKRFLARVAEGLRVTWYIVPSSEAHSSYEVFTCNGKGGPKLNGGKTFATVREAQQYCEEKEGAER